MSKRYFRLRSDALLQGEDNVGDLISALIQGSMLLEGSLQVLPLPQCGTCHGEGQIVNRLSLLVECPTCKGDGYLEETAL